jgi:hypothetical protein
MRILDDYPGFGFLIFTLPGSRIRIRITEFNFTFSWFGIGLVWLIVMGTVLYWNLCCGSSRSDPWIIVLVDKDPKYIDKYGSDPDLYTNPELFRGRIRNKIRIRGVNHCQNAFRLSEVRFTPPRLFPRTTSTKPRSSAWRNLPRRKRWSRLWNEVALPRNNSTYSGCSLVTWLGIVIF